ncbi:MAG: AsmA family protein [Deltaproteobacteria bacterium]|nr:AsmA family protein [Deltaproteobacteria bacterium]
MTEVVSSPPITAPLRRLKLKKAGWIGLGILVFLLAVLLVMPHFVDLGLFKRTYLPLLEEALNHRIDVGEVHLSLVPTPAIRLSNLKVSDSAAAADNTLFTAQQLRLKLRFWPLLRGRFEITELVLVKPVFNLLKQPDGSFNYADAGARKNPTETRREARKKSDAIKPAARAPVPLAIPNRVRVQDGELNVISRGSAPLQIRGIELSLQEFAGAAPFPFRLAFNYPGVKNIFLDGELDYQEDKALIELKNNRLKISELTFPVQGTVSNLATTPRVNLTLRGDNVEAKAIMQILANAGLAPRGVEVSGAMDIALILAGPSNALASQLHSELKNVKFRSQRAGNGSLSGDVKLKLPLGGGALARRLQGSGKLAARDGELTNVELIKKIQRVTGMIGLSKDEQRQATTFQKLEADFTLHDGIADFSRLYLINPQMEVDGAGTMTLEQPTLNLALNTALSSRASARAGRARAASFLKDKQGKIVVPLKVTGPADNPSVNVNSEKLAESALPKSVEKGFGSFFKGLFRNR